MAETSCSSSNPLKSLAQEGTKDRSLHQDRQLHDVGVSSFRHTGATSLADSSLAYRNFSAMKVDSRSIPGPASHLTGNLDISELGRRIDTASSMQPNGPSEPGAYYRPSGWHSDFEQFAGQAPRPLRDLTWATDFQAFTKESGEAGSHGNHVLTGSMPLSTHLWHDLGVPHRNVLSAREHPFLASRPSGFVNWTYPDLSRSAPGHQPGHMEVETAAAQAEFDRAMAAWMALNEEPRTSGLDDTDGIAPKLVGEQNVASRRIEDKDVQRTEISNVSDTNIITQERSNTPADARLAIDLRTGDESLAFRASKEDSGSGVPQDLSTLSLDDSQKMTDHTSPGPEVRSQVSEAARQLLETVEREEGDKWRKSQFLMLMREFRDGSKDIVNNEIRETNRS